MGQHRDVVSCAAARHPSKINPLQVFQKDNFFTEDPPAETIRPREVAKKNDFFAEDARPRKLKKITFSLPEDRPHGVQKNHFFNRRALEELVRRSRRGK